MHVLNATAFGVMNFVNGHIAHFVDSPQDECRQVRECDVGDTARESLEKRTLAAARVDYAHHASRAT